MQTQILFRPVGEKEMLLIIESGYTKFPPRLAWQPLFYPVLNEQYATEIARDWNTQDEAGNYLGFVTRFLVDKKVSDKYEVKNVGGIYHNELWIPAEELDLFNESIVGKIEIVSYYIGNKFSGSTSELIHQILKSKH